MTTGYADPMSGEQDALGWLRKIRVGLWHLRHGGIPQWRLWRSRQRLNRVTGTAEIRSDSRGQLTFPPAELPACGPRRTDITAAVILDDFSQMAWGYEFNLVAVTPRSWRSELAIPVDLLFVESAWHGNQDAWQYHLAGSSAPSPELKELVEWCRAQGIPTVFWNKEDPPHFDDFIDTAALFDVVFTTDANLIETYRSRLGHDRIGVLPFAAQDAVHNPIRPSRGWHERDVAFGGMYFAHKYPQRRAQMDLLLGGALDASSKLDHGLEIFSRFLGADERYQFPPGLAERVVGSLSYPEMLTAYKAYKVFLNVNSVVDSPSMCARRVFEIVASGTPVISTRSAAIPSYFTDEQVPIADTREDAASLVRALVRSPELSGRMVHLAQREVWTKHTYRHRAVDLLQALGLPADPPRLPSVSAMIVTNRPHQVDHALASVAAQRGVEVQLVLVTHGFQLSPEDLRSRLTHHGITEAAYSQADPSWELGTCLRRAVDLAEGEYAAKMDDDDIYGPYYLHDLLCAQRFSGAEVVGKEAHYMHLSAQQAVLLRFPEREHRWTDRVMGPTITAARRLFQEIPFADLTKGEDTDWLRRASQAGARIYSSDRYNFAQVRHGSHTWDVTDRSLLATGEVVFFGDPRSHLSL